jgi:arginine repressor
MKLIAKVIGRLLAVLVDKGVISGDDAIFVLCPLKEGEEE